MLGGNKQKLLNTLEECLVEIDTDLRECENAVHSLLEFVTPHMTCNHTDTCIEDYLKYKERVLKAFETLKGADVEFPTTALAKV